MDAYSYSDIFDTKGIEYLIVIAFLLLLIPTWIWLNKPGKAKKLINYSPRGIDLSLLQIPHGLMFDKNHTWAFLQPSGSAKIGLDDLLLHLTGGVSVEYFKNKGDKVRKGDVIASIHQDGKLLEFASPVSGRLESVNQNLVAQQGIINQDPYGKGWLCKIEPENWRQETSSCLMGEDAEEWEKNELERIKDFLSGSMDTVKSSDLPKPVMQAGGELTEGVLVDFPAEIWKKFQSEILENRK